MLRKWLALLLVTLLCLQGLAHIAHAQEDDAPAGDAEGDSAPEAEPETKEAYEEDYDEDEDAGPITPHGDVEHYVQFAGSPDKKIPIGEPVTMLVSLHNKGSNDFNVTHMGASLHSAYDYNYMIQNYSQRVFPLGTTILRRGSQMSLEYTFTIRPDLEPMQLWFSAWVAYNISQDLYASAVFNNTVELVEGSSGRDYSRIFTYFFIAAVVGLVGYLFTNPGASSPKAKTNVERGTRESVTAQIYTPKESASAVRRRSGSRKASKKKKST